MNDIQKKQPSAPKVKSVNLMDMVLKIWTGRKFILKVCIIAAFIGLVIGFSIPKEYTTSVTMASESSSKASSGNLGALASMAGINIGSSGGGETLSPNLYPDIVRSTPFIIDLFNVKVTTTEGAEISLYEYFDKYQHAPWWSYITSAPSKARGLISSLFNKEKSMPATSAKPNTFHITREQNDKINAISSSIETTVNMKSGLIYISVTMQDPLVSAALTDTVMQNLQSYIVNYRTNKAKRDLDYTEKLYQDAKNNYYSAQQRYAEFADSNLDIVMSGYRTRLERLQNESSLAFSLYNQLSQQLQLSKARIQEVTPVYTVIQPASVPMNAEGPGKLMILVVSLFLALAGSIGWILYGKDFVNKLLKSRPHSD